MLKTKEGKMPPIEPKKLDRGVSVLKAMAHPVRLKIIKILMDRECNVTNLERDIGLSQSGVSQHLRILRLSGVIEPERDGKEICYRIIDPVVEQIVKLIAGEPA